MKPNQVLLLTLSSVVLFSTSTRQQDRTPGIVKVLRAKVANHQQIAKPQRRAANIPLNFYVDRKFSTDQIKQIRKAFDTINTASGLTLIKLLELVDAKDHFYKRGFVYQTNANYILLDTQKHLLQEKGYPTFAHTHWDKSRDRIRNAIIRINGTEIQEISARGFYNIVLHESLHALGLRHIPFIQDRQTIMRAEFSKEFVENITGLSKGDVTRLIKKYAP